MAFSSGKCTNFLMTANQPGWPNRQAIAANGLSFVIPFVITFGLLVSLLCCYRALKSLLFIIACSFPSITHANEKPILVREALHFIHIYNHHRILYRVCVVLTDSLHCTVRVRYDWEIVIYTKICIIMITRYLHGFGQILRRSTATRRLKLMNKKLTCVLTINYTPQGKK
jgi:hypothetical protein